LLTPLRRRLDASLRRRSPAALLVGALVAVIALAYGDFTVGPPGLTPILFYLVPTVLVAWYAGRGPGLLVACAAALAWLLTDALTHGPYAAPWIPYANGALRLGALLVVSEVVARLRAARERERQLARSDHLTGAPNLRSFYERAASEIARARRYVHPFSVAYVDLDEFRQINERVGHLAGDAVLCSAARVIGSVLRVSDVVARLGGDEFVMLLPETGSAPARLAVDKVRRALAEVVPVDGWRLTACVGMVTYLVPPASVDELLGAAARLLDTAKQSGRDAVAQETRNEVPRER
jgi:diguanylate cyclase (GGDEF)-like protein